MSSELIGLLDPDGEGFERLRMPRQERREAFAMLRLLCSSSIGGIGCEG